MTGRTSLVGRRIVLRPRLRTYGDSVLAIRERVVDVTEELASVADIPFIRASDGRTYYVDDNDGSVWDDDDYHVGRME